MPSYSFCKSHRLLRRGDFKHVLDRGYCVRTKRFIIFIYPNALDHHRLGLIVTKKVANSVYRNRIKRLIREYFRIHYIEKTWQARGHDIVFIAKRGCDVLEFGEFDRELRGLYETVVDRLYCSISKDVITSSASQVQVLS